MAVLAVYLPTLRHGFHFDDHHMVAGNLFTKDWGSAFRTFLTGQMSSVPLSKGMYRPVLMVSFAWDYSNGGMNPLGYHLTNIWLHLLVFSVAVGLALRLWPAVSSGWILLAGLLWAVHPIQTEAVAYVSSRSSALATLWMLISLWLFCAGSDRAGDRGLSPKGTVPFVAGSLAAYALALGSKEIAVTLPGLLLLAAWRMRALRQACPEPAVRPSTSSGRTGPASVRASTGSARTVFVKWLLPFLLLTAAYLLWRKTLFGAFGVVRPVRPWAEDIRMQLEGILSYLRLLFFPVHQSIVHPQPMGEGLLPWLGLGAAAGLALLAWRARRRLPGLAFALGWAGLSFLPVAFASSLNLVVAEHHLYLPSVGLALGLPPLLQSLATGNFRLPIVDFRFKPSISLTCLGLVGILSVATLRRNAVWRDDFTLWADCVAKAPLSCLAHSNLGLEREGRGQYEDALISYLRALSLAQDRTQEATVRNNLGNLLGFLGRPQEALTQFERCLAINPYESGMHFNNIGLAYSDMKEPEKAEEAYTKALDADPRKIEAYLNLGSLWFRQGRRQEAGSLFKRAAELDPDHWQANLVLGKFHISEGMFRSASAVFRRLIRLRPKWPQGHLYLAVSCLRQEPPRRQEGLAHLKKARALGWRQDESFLDALAPYLEADLSAIGQKAG